jgi:molybdopterin-guanine dinucleotide biosynthesis protein A
MESLKLRDSVEGNSIPFRKEIKVAGLVLAGGKSSRFGSDKRFYTIDKKTLLWIACVKMAEVCDVNYLAVDRQFEDDNVNVGGFFILRDSEDWKGPLLGIYSAMLHKPDQGYLVIPVDMPNLSIQLLKHMKSKAKLYDLIVLYDNEYIPLPGYYSSSLLPLIRYSISNQDYSLKSLIGTAVCNDDFKVLKLYTDDIREFGDPKKILLNINKKEDIAEIDYNN